MFACTLASHAQVGQWQTYERLIQEGEPRRPYDIIYVQGTPTNFYNDTVSIHHTCMPDSYVAYFGMDYTPSQLETLFGNWGALYNPSEVDRQYWFDDESVMVNLKEYHGISSFYTTTSRYFVKIGNITLRVGDCVSDIQLPPNIINEAIGNVNQVNIAIYAKITSDVCDIVFRVCNEDNIITRISVDIVDELP
jgi:hypothetical protein